MQHYQQVSCMHIQAVFVPDAVFAFGAMNNVDVAKVLEDQGMVEVKPLPRRLSLIEEGQLPG